MKRSVTGGGMKIDRVLVHRTCTACGEVVSPVWEDCPLCGQCSGTSLALRRAVRKARLSALGWFAGRLHLRAAHLNAPVLESTAGGRSIVDPVARSEYPVLKRAALMLYRSDLQYRVVWNVICSAAPRAGLQAPLTRHAADALQAAEVRDRLAGRRPLAVFGPNV